MEKILVTTDQSTNSKSAIRFGIKLAKQREAELIILHIYHLLKPFKWSKQAFEEYADNFRKKRLKNYLHLLPKSTRLLTNLKRTINWYWYLTSMWWMGSWMMQASIIALIYALVRVVRAP
jgi:hypothetical protein